MSVFFKRAIAAATTLLLAASLPSAAAASGPVDVTSTAQGQVEISQAVAQFKTAGHNISASDLVATEFPDGTTVIARRGLKAADLRGGGGGFRLTAAALTPSGTLALRSVNSVVVAAAPYWAPSGDGCFASLMRGPAHFDVCYGIYKMANDGSSTYDYWRVDLNGTMFAEGKKLKWGWIAVDRDAGPGQSFTTNGWSPAQDEDHTCASTSLGISVLGVGASYGYTQCESWNITKTSGSALGSFKNYWNWGTRLPLVDRDRGVALMIGTRGSPGTPTFGLSWDFAIF